MNKTFVINGGAGRVVAAIPALEKFHKLNPDNDFKVLVYGWESLYWSHPILQNRTFSISQKGIFDLIIKNSELVEPEPYNRRSYYTQQKSLAEAFDEEINQTDSHDDLGAPKLYLQKHEVNSFKNIIEDKKKQFNREKVIVFQPYGSGISINNNRPIDLSSRSVDVDDYLKIANTLSNKYLVVYFGDKNFIHPGDNVTWKPSEELQADLRFWMACINGCDYFLGVDSVGQHMARSFNKKGTVIMGSTFEINVSYPGHFKFFRNGLTPTYDPIRLSPADCEFSQRSNDCIMDFNNNQITELCNLVDKDLNISKNVWGW